MRVVIVSPPKSGANRLRCLMATAYGIRAVDARDAPATDDPEQFVDWLAMMPEDSVIHTNLVFHPTLPAAVASLGVTLIAIVRHPFDLFVSNREVQANRVNRATRRARHRDGSDEERAMQLSSEKLDPIGAFATDLQSLINWTAVASATVRYEDILQRPEIPLAANSAIFGSLSSDQISHAVKLCPAEQRIVSSNNRGVRMAEIAPGAWRNEIDPATLSTLQREYAPAVVALGYQPSLTAPT